MRCIQTLSDKKNTKIALIDRKRVCLTHEIKKNDSGVLFTVTVNLLIIIRATIAWIQLQRKRAM